MANRHLSRSVAMQSLFEWDFNDASATSEQMEDITRENIAEFAPGLDNNEFVFSLVNGVIAQQKQLDDIIEKAAPDWPIAQIALVDRNVLRIGLYELLFANKAEVPARVAINEAIELAKTFGGENSGKFVNGVLGAVYREMGEPGKDDVPAKKKRPKDVPYEQMPIEKLCGAMVYIKDGDEYLLALVHDIFGHWTLSKGHTEEGEDLRQATVREIKEEMSLDVETEDELGFNEYIASDPEKGKIRKQVNYFLAQAKDKDALELKKSGGLDNARWFALGEIADLDMYDDILPIITKGITILKSK